MRRAERCIFPRYTRVPLSGGECTYSVCEHTLLCNLYLFVKPAKERERENTAIRARRIEINSGEENLRETSVYTQERRREEMSRER